MIRSANRTVAHSRWSLPLFSLALGVVVFAVSWLGGQLGAGVISLVILAGSGLVILLLTGRDRPRPERASVRLAPRRQRADVRSGHRVLPLARLIPAADPRIGWPARTGPRPQCLD